MVYQDYSPDLGSSFGGSARLRRLVRAAGNIRVLLLGLPGAAGARKTTRPIATGTLSFPAFGSN